MIVHMHEDVHVRQAVVEEMTQADVNGKEDDAIESGSNALDPLVDCTTNALAYKYTPSTCMH
jgi:hypothetical protein